MTGLPETTDDAQAGRDARDKQMDLYEPCFEGDHGLRSYGRLWRRALVMGYEVGLAPLGIGFAAGIPLIRWVPKEFGSGLIQIDGLMPPARQAAALAVWLQVCSGEYRADIMRGVVCAPGPDALGERPQPFRKFRRTAKLRKRAASDQRKVA